MVLGEAFPPKSLQESPGRGYSDQVGTAAGMLFFLAISRLWMRFNVLFFPLPILNFEETEESEEMEYMCLYMKDMEDVENESSDRFDLNLGVLPVSTGTLWTD